MTFRTEELRGSDGHAYVRRFEDFVIGWLPNRHEQTAGKKKSNGYIIFGQLYEDHKMFAGSYQKYGVTAEETEE